MKTQYWDEATKYLPPTSIMKAEILAQICELTGMKPIMLDLTEVNRIIDAREEWHRKRLAKYGELLIVCSKLSILSYNEKVKMATEGFYEEAAFYRSKQGKYVNLYKYLLYRMTREPK